MSVAIIPLTVHAGVVTGRNSDRPRAASDACIVREDHPEVPGLLLRREPAGVTFPPVLARMQHLEARLAALVAALAAFAAAGGILLPDLYRDPLAIRPAMQGQDLVTLFAAPLVYVFGLLAARGSMRARLVAIGLVGYVGYTYAGAAFGYRFNPFLIVYTALLSLSVAAIVIMSRRLDVAAIHAGFGGHAPRRQVAVFLLAIGVMLGALELAQIGTYLATGVVPLAVSRAGDWTFFPYVLDLGFVVPLAILSAWSLWRDRPIGDALAAILLVKAVTMGLALLAMNAVSSVSGLPTDGLTPFYGAIALGGGSLSFWFLVSGQQRVHHAVRP